MREGSLVQVGTPVEVYGAPVDVWAAGLTGPVSILDVRVAGRPDGRASVTLPDDALTTPQASRAGPGHGETAEVLVRPEWARFGGPLSGIVKRVDFHGSYTDHVVTTAAGDLIIRTLGGPAASAGSTVTWSLDRVHLVPGATELAASD